MTRKEERRAAIVERLADHVLATGLAGSSLRPLAEAAGLSDRMLLYYFKDKAEVMTAALALIAARLGARLEAGLASEPLPLPALRRRIADIMLTDALWPYMQVWLETTSLAARGEPLYAQVGEQLARGFLAWGMAQLDSPEERRASDAAILLMTIEGLVLLKSVGLEAECRAAL